jgi:hypothetical protein
VGHESVRLGVLHLPPPPVLPGIAEGGVRGGPGGRRLVSDDVEVDSSSS